MYNNSYLPNYYNQQASLERINEQISQLENLKKQMQQPQPQQPTSLTQNFQLAPTTPTTPITTEIPIITNATFNISRDS